MAKQWREGLQRIDLKTIANTLRDIGIDNTTCRTLEDARAMARTVVSGRDKPFARIALVMAILDVPHQHQTLSNAGQSQATHRLSKTRHIRPKYSA